MLNFLANGFRISELNSTEFNTAPSRWFVNATLIKSSSCLLASLISPFSDEVDAGQ